MATSADIFQAFKAWWNRQTALSAFLGPYRDVAPGLAPPFVIFTSVSNTQFVSSSESEYWRSVAQISYFDKSFDVVESAIETIGGLVDGAQLSVQNGPVLQLRRMTERYMTDDEFVAHGMLQYKIERYKSRS